jgi:hypothetical protein
MYMISLSSSAVECCGFEETLRASQLAVVGVDKCIFSGGSKTTLRRHLPSSFLLLAHWLCFDLMQPVQIPLNTHDELMNCWKGKDGWRATRTPTRLLSTILRQLAW